MIQTPEDANERGEEFIRKVQEPAIHASDTTHNMQIAFRFREPRC